jgi:hypothetical protein
MQRFISIIALIFLLAGLAWPQLVQAQDNEQLLAKADALYDQKKFGEAFNIYQNLLAKGGQYSPQMLGKMAFIGEGSGDYANALYYLNLLYAHKPAPKIYEKINELAEKHKLEGYQPSDVEYLIYNLRYYLGYLTAAFALVVLGLLFLLFRLKQRGREVLYPCIAVSLVLAIFFYVYNYQLQPKKAIVKAEKAFMMNAPSAGGELVATVAKGNCYPIVEKKDIWYKVRWVEQDVIKEGYLRGANVFVID